MNKIESIGNIIIKEKEWIINLPLFPRATVVLFSWVYLSRVGPILNKFCFDRGIVVEDGIHIYTTEYHHKNGLYVLEDTVVGTIEKYGEHSQKIVWNVPVVGTDLQHFSKQLQTVFDTVLMEMYSRI